MQRGRGGYRGAFPRGAPGRSWRPLGHAAWLVVAAMVTLACAAPAARPPAAAPAAPNEASAPAAPAVSNAPAASSAPAPAAPAVPAPLMTVRVAHAGGIGSAGRFIAQERGYYQEEGIAVEEIPFDTSTTMLPALAAGQIDVATGGIAASLFNAVAQGIPVRIVLDVWSAVPGNESGGLLVRKDLIDGGQVRTLADLRGRRVGITSRGHATEFALDLALQREGLTVADVEPTLLPYPDMNVALANGNVEGAVTIDPFAALAVSQGIAVRFKPWPELVPHDQPAMLMFSEDFADNRTEAGQRFAKAYVRGLRAYDEARTKGTNREEVIGYMMKLTELKDRAIYDTMPWPSNNPDGRVNGEIIATAQDWMFDHGYVKTKIDLARVIDSRFADYAVAQLGPYQP
jgi:NitT/TauT family transport system substrate-binding protein